MDFTLPPEIEDIRLRTRAFVAEHVLPLEADPENFSEHENIPLERLAPVQAQARKATGLWAPQSPKEFGGMALPIVAWAAIYEEAARSVFGPLGDQLHGARRRQHESARRAPARRRRRNGGCGRSSRARCSSAFAMTEPRAGRRLRSRHDPHPRREEGRQMGDPRPQMVHHRRRRRGAFHRHRPHLGRQAPRPDRVPLSPRPAGLAHRAPHSDHGTGGARRPLRARIRRPRSRRRQCAARRRRRAEGDADPARPGAADALHALARPGQALPRDRAGLCQQPRGLRHQARRPRERADQARRRWRSRSRSAGC